MRGTLLITALLANVFVVGQQPQNAVLGKVIRIERRGRFYDYSVFSRGCGYIGRSTKKIDVQIDTDVTFWIEGNSLSLV